jgi:hypothetical protein
MTAVYMPEGMSNAEVGTGRVRVSTQAELQASCQALVISCVELLTVRVGTL